MAADTIAEAKLLAEKITIITGAARGIGAAIARRFAAAGSLVIAVDLEEPSELVFSIEAEGGQAVPVALDVTDHGMVEHTIQQLAAEYAPCDILVNNAGIIARETIENLSHEKWRSVMDVNLNGAFNMCKAVVPYMQQRKSGSILNITSIAGKMGDITASPVYGTSKGAVNTLTRSLARQLAEYSITVNAVAPHAVETDMSAEWSQEKRSAVIESIPLKRLARPEEIADAALFLVSPSARFITGEVLNVNGGALMD
ncbi:SDR family NAD(P)-dependent oxidoreductase [Marispirochaeta aestuarii]|uniref:SDR family NAD(P)-dependent oxidoreductase n=1 Tax=Marispirochaeta aestuarii TaxID=1963862 RepID=UPI0029C6AB39|nr:SDR family NAD(P)-dependent oxidoreductase [Marispirochaeta aestuarii]